MVVLCVLFGFFPVRFGCLNQQNYPKITPSTTKTETTPSSCAEDAAKNATPRFRKVTKPWSKQVFVPLIYLEAAHHNSKTPLRDRVPVASSLPLRDRNPRAHGLSERPCLVLFWGNRGTQNNKWVRQNQKCQSFGSLIERPFFQWNRYNDSKNCENIHVWPEIFLISFCWNHLSQFIHVKGMLEQSYPRNIQKCPSRSRPPHLPTHLQLMEVSNNGWSYGKFPTHLGAKRTLPNKLERVK